jgi:hypothetical protein avisC_03421
MGEQQDVALRRVIVAILVVLNISVVCFYVLWEVADTIAVNRAEEHGFDPQQLLPHNILFWLAAQASLLSLLALDVLMIVAWRRRRRWQKLQTAVNDSSEPVIQVDQQWISAAPRSESDRIGNPEPSMR